MTDWPGWCLGEALLSSLVKESDCIVSNFTLCTCYLTRVSLESFRSLTAADAVSSYLQHRLSLTRANGSRSITKTSTGWNDEPDQC